MNQQIQTRKQHTESLRNPDGIGRARNRDVHEPSQDTPVKEPKSWYEETVNLAEMKDLARQLPERSTAKELILKMDNSLPRWIAVGQLLLIHKVLYEEYGR